MILPNDAEPILIAGTNTGKHAAHSSSAPTRAPHVSPSAMKLILLLVAMAIVVFMVSTVYSVRTQIRGNSELLAIKNTYFPVLQKLDANVARVDKLTEIYVQVVATGDRELLAKASEMCAAANNAFNEINRLYSGRETDIAILRSDLKQYEELATKVSLALLDSPDTDVSELSASMSSALSDLKTRLAAQRQSSYDGFVQTLAASQRDARIILYLGLALGLMNLGFIAVLVYFIRTNGKMMSVIAEQNATLELRVTERTAQLSQKTKDINAMLQNMKLGVATVVPGNRIHQEYSSYLRTIFGIEDFAGKELTETILTRSHLSLDAKHQMVATLGAILGSEAKMFDANHHLLAREMRLDEGDGTSKIVQMDWSPIINEQGSVDKLLLICQDVSQQKQLEAELLQARKLESIGQLSAGIAHEINTPTQFIGNNVEFVRDSVVGVLEFVASISSAIDGNEDSTHDRAQWTNALARMDFEYLRVEVPRAIEQSLEGINRIKTIVGAMKEFSHPATEKALVDLNRAIESTVIVASNEWKYVAEVKTEFDITLPQVMVMPGSFNQVILNILVNAAHAIGDLVHRDPAIKGVITISTRRVDDWAEVRIQDTGGGIPKNILNKIFDPFFTTKPVGKGTGQGLAIAHDVVVKKHGGALTVESNPGTGTIFIIRLPLEKQVPGVMQVA